MLSGNTTVQFTLAIPTEGTLTASIASGAVVNEYGYPGLAYAASYAANIGTAPFPVPLTAVNPLGSLVYQGSTTGLLAWVGDTNSFTIALDAGQTLTACVLPAAALQANLTITAPGGATLGSATAAAAGKQTFVQTVPSAPRGRTRSPSARRRARSAPTRSSWISMRLSRSRSHDGATNNTFASAQSLDSAFVSLGGSAERAAVLGATDGIALIKPLPRGILDADPGSTCQGQWAWGQPTGGGGVSYGYPDPTAGHTGSDVCGVNLNGDYSTTIGGPYYLTTTAINCTGETNVQLSFWRWLNSDYPPYVTATIDVSNNGTTWTNVYSNTAASP